jgi:hypothetical protein
MISALRGTAIWRCAILGLALAANGAASGADLTAAPKKRHPATRAARGLPPPPVYVEDSDALISAPTTPLLAGSSALPGYYGRAFSYAYQGPYYGGAYEGYFWRLPYACGVYGYC